MSSVLSTCAWGVGASVTTGAVLGATASVSFSVPLYFMRMIVNGGIDCWDALSGKYHSPAGNDQDSNDLKNVVVSSALDGALIGAKVGAIASPIFITYGFASNYFFGAD